MGFNNSTFLFGFLPLLLLAHHFTEVQHRNRLVLAASLLFFAWGEPVFVFVLMATTLLDYFLVRWMDRKEGRARKTMLVLSLGMNGALLFLFKYLPPMLEGFLGPQTKPEGFLGAFFDVSLPIGISFFTFESVTYVVDVYRKEQRPAASLSRYFLYIFFFPKLVAGPIIRYCDFGNQLSPASRNYDTGFALTGFYRLIMGFGKKILIADQLRLYIVNPVFNAEDLGNLHPGMAWLGLFSATIMIYADFSGYSDMAIGLSRLLGFSIPQNFRHPFMARSIREFWERWHISLGSWLRQYVYFPLGGSRKGNGRKYLNLLLVFVVCGLWHGASLNYLIWGLLYGLVVVLENVAGNRFRTLPSWLGNGYVLLVVMGANMVFMTEYPGEILAFAGSLFRFSHPGDFQVYAELWPFLSAGVALAWLPGLPDRISRRVTYMENLNTTGHIAWTAASVLVLVLGAVWMTASSYNSFLYFRF